MTNIKTRKIRPGAKIPIRASDGAVGYDVFASRVLDKNNKRVISKLPAVLEPEGSILIGIGIQMAVPFPVDCEVRPRSGLATRKDIELSNSPGTIDPDFRGEAGVLLRNRGSKPFTVKSNMRIAQLIFKEVLIPVFEEVDELSATVRGTSGFGDTGLFGLGLGTSRYSDYIKETDKFYMTVALAAAERSMCVRGVKRVNGKYKRDKRGRLIGQKRKFGCVIVKDDNVIAHGFNAQRPGPKCIDEGCLREELGIPSGTKLEKCRAMHAEWWALTNALRTGGAAMQGATMYINAEPCEVCATMITGTGVGTVVTLKGIYPTNGVKILSEAGINVRYVSLK